MRRRDPKEFQKIWAANSEISKLIDKGQASSSALLDALDHENFALALEEGNFAGDVMALGEIELSKHDEQPREMLLRRRALLIKMLDKTDKRLAEL